MLGAGKHRLESSLSVFSASPRSQLVFPCLSSLLRRVGLPLTLPACSLALAFAPSKRQNKIADGLARLPGLQAICLFGRLLALPLFDRLGACACFGA